MSVKKGVLPYYQDIHPANDTPEERLRLLSDLRANVMQNLLFLGAESVRVTCGVKVQHDRVRCWVTGEGFAPRHRKDIEMPFPLLNRSAVA